jgi:arylsulfatase A-like enzyme
MIVKFPGQKTGTLSDLPVSHVDVLPTVLDIAGLPQIDGTEGQSLASPILRPVYSHLDLGRHPLQYSVVVGTWKLIRRHGETVSLELYDIASDPRETRDLADRMPIRTAAMASLIRARIADTGITESEGLELSDETARELRALGYLG